MMNSVINPLDLPWFRRLACWVLVVARLPGTLWLLFHGQGLQALGATLVGVLLGRRLRLALRGADRLFLMILSARLMELATPDDHFRQLLDQCLIPLMVIVLWPDGSGQWLKSALERLIRVRQGWSSGVQMHPCVTASAGSTQE